MNLTTVIIPVYNGEKHIERTLKSVLSQSKECNIIIINDGSIDSTDKICRDVKKGNENINYVEIKNSGVSAARNLGIKLSNTKFISFLDGDDTYDSNFVEKMEKKILETSTDLCFCGNNNIYQDQKEPKKIVFRNNDIFQNYLKNRTTPHTNSWLINREFLIKNNIFFEVGNNFGEDMIFFSSLLLSKPKVSNVPEELTNYYLDIPNSLTKKDVNKIDKDIYWCSKVVENIKNSDFSDNEKKKFESIIMKYRLPVGIIYTIGTNKVSINEKRKQIAKYKDYIDIFNLSNGLRSVKGIFLYIKLLFEVKNND